MFAYQLSIASGLKIVCAVCHTLSVVGKSMISAVGLLISPLFVVARLCSGSHHSY